MSNSSTVPSGACPPTFTGGILERSGGLLNPGKFVHRLRRAVLQSTARVSEGTHVDSIESRADGVFVTTRGARVHAAKALIATNAYSRDLPSAPRRMVAPLWVTLAETEPIGTERLLETGWTSRSGVYTQHVILESYRPTAEGSVVFGTRQVQVPSGRLDGRRPDPRVLADLIRGFYDRFPSLADVSVRRTWGGWIAMTPSWLPVVGEAAPNTLYLGGYNGHGLAQGPYLGTLVADVLAGGAAPRRSRGLVAPASSVRSCTALLVTRLESGVGVRSGLRPHDGRSRGRRRCAGRLRAASY